jgi:cytochrome c biogenesis protein CcmG/thiol:disulfide interchange protein DsbE
MPAQDPEALANQAVSRKRSLLVFLPLAIFLALSALFFIRLFAGDASRLPSALIGKQVPSFDLPAVEGLSGVPGFSDKDLRQGQVTLVNVFASWCVPCHQEHPLLMSLASDTALAQRGVHVLGLAYKDSPENIAKFLRDKGNPYEKAGTDRAGRTAIDWGVYGVPETYVVKGDGTIAYRFVGPMTEDDFRNIVVPEIKKAR